MNKFIFIKGSIMGTTIYRDTVENSNLSSLIDIKTQRCIHARAIIKQILNLIPLYTQKSSFEENYNPTGLVKITSTTTFGIEKIDFLLSKLSMEIKNIDYDSIKIILSISKETDRKKLETFLNEYAKLSSEKIMLQTQLSELLSR